jgi:hypothetical protein
MRMPPDLPGWTPAAAPEGTAALPFNCYQAGPLWQPLGTAMSDWTFSETPRAPQTGAPAARR